MSQANVVGGGLDSGGFTVPILDLRWIGGKYRALLALLLIRELSGLKEKKNKVTTKRKRNKKKEKKRRKDDLDLQA